MNAHMGAHMHAPHSSTVISPKIEQLDECGLRGDLDRSSLFVSFYLMLLRQDQVSQAVHQRIYSR